MQLSATLFDEITGISEPTLPADESQLFDRRQHHRFLVGSRATIYPICNGVESAPAVVLIRDISVAGLSILHADCMKVDEFFIIRLTGQSGLPIRIRCIVRRCEAGGMGRTQYVIGSTFEEVIEPTEAELLAAAAAAAPSPAPPEAEQSPPAAAPLAGQTPEDRHEKPVSPDVAPGAAEIRRRLISTNPPSQASASPADDALAARSQMPEAEVVWKVYDSPSVPDPMWEDPSQESTSKTPISFGSSSPGEQVAGAQGGRNQEILAKVKSHWLKQIQLAQDQAQQLAEINGQLARQRQENARLADELAHLKQTLDTLHAKSEADDLSIAELAALLESELVPSREGAEAA